MRVLFDTNVVLDVLMDRAPFSNWASALFDAVDAGRIVGLLGGTTLTTVYFLLRRSTGATVALEKVRLLISRFEIAPVGRSVIEGALDLGFTDFEDAVLHEAGRQARAESVVTRNGDDFRGGTLLVYTPPELLAQLDAV